MNAFVAVALALCTSVGASAGPAFAETAMQVAAIDAALGSDDACANRGEEASTCAFSALQLQAHSEEGASCSGGIIGKIKSMAPGCLDYCPQTCGPLQQAINAFMTKGGKNAVYGPVCANVNAFACIYGAYAKGACWPLLAKGAAFGVPSSAGALYAACR